MGKPTAIGSFIGKVLGNDKSPMPSSSDLERFVQAQNDRHSGDKTALSEISEGHMESLWIWYVFPQLRGLGHSAVEI